MKLETYKMLLLLMLFTALASCKKAEGPDMNYYIESPINLTLNAVKTTLHATWEYAGKENSGFLVELASDANFTKILKTETLGASETSVDFNDLGYFSEAFVRVRALSSNIILHSGYVSAFIKPESIFKSVLKSELTATSAILRWDLPSSGTLSSILVIDNKNNTERTLTLSAQNISSQSLLVDGLESAGSYTAVIFAGDERVGVLTFNAVDLNATISIEGSTVIYETLQLAVDAAKSSDIINIGAAKYDFSSTAQETVTINGKSLEFRAKPGSTSVPEITMKNFWLKGAITSFKLSGIKIISTSFGNRNGTNTDYNKHLIGISYVTGSINVTVENCDLTGAESGLIFTQTPGAANLPEGAVNPANISLTVDNCLLHDFGNAGGDFIDFRSGRLGNIVYKNTSFWKGARAFFRMDQDVTIAPGSTITIENSTFYAFSNGGIFLRNNGVKENVAFVLNNNIVMNKTSNHGNAIGAGTLKLNNNNISGTNAANITNGVTAGFNIGTTALDPSFANAEGGDFTVGNAVLKTAGLGDPRWLK